MKVHFYFVKQKLGDKGRPQEWLYARYRGIIYRTNITKTKIHKMSRAGLEDFRNHIMWKLGALGKEWDFIS